MSDTNDVVMSPSSGAALDWQFLQCFGERTPGEDIQEADIISAVQFDHDGMHLATGDRGGRVVLFERVQAPQRPARPDQRSPPPGPRSSSYEYRYLTEFQSHEPEFDYLKSLEIEEKINQVTWCRTSNSSKMILSTNDKTIKLWKVFGKTVTSLTDFNVPSRLGGGVAGGAARPSSLNSPQRLTSAQALRLPRVASSEHTLSQKCRRVYANAHTYHINSISVNSDQQTFLSADDLRINLWNFEVTDQSFNIVDIKPPNMEDLTEVITSALFHPRHCNIVAYSSSKGVIRLADMRDAALCDKQAKAFEEPEQAAGKSFFSEIIASISDISFSRCGRYILSRDYMSLKLWDMAMERKPVSTLLVHEGLRAKLCDLYENDSIFDKFDCCMSGSGEYLATGSYNNTFRVFGCNGESELTLEASRDPMRKRLQTPAKQASANRFGIRKTPGSGNKRGGADADAGGANDYTSKLLHLAWHPEANVIAAAASNSLYLHCV